MIECITQLPLNTIVTKPELDRQCKAIFGGIGWPSKKPGFALLAAMHISRHFDGHDIYLLAEYESFDIRQIVKWCSAQDQIYSPQAWYGDARNQAADKLIKEMYDELQSPRDHAGFFLSPSPMIEIEHIYAYSLPIIKALLEPERRMLFLKESKVKDYLWDVEDEQISQMTFGEYPAIEALCFAVIELKKQYPDQRPVNLTRDREPDQADIAMSYATKSAFD